MGNAKDAPGTPRSYRTFDFAAAADARIAAFAGASGDDGGTARTLRAERRLCGGPGYDLLRHIGLVRRLRRSLRAGGAELGPTVPRPAAAPPRSKDVAPHAAPERLTVSGNR